MPVYYTPGVYFEKIDSARGKISGIRTDIPGFIGIAEKGLLDTPVRLESWKQFQSVFGGFIPQSYLAYAVNGFFENKGDTCYVVRIADTCSAKKATTTLLDKNRNPTIKVSAINEGQWGNKIRISLEEASMGSTIAAGSLKEFTLTFSLGNKTKEIFKNLSMNPAHKRYFEKVINGQSNLVTVEDKHSSSPIPANLTDPQKLRSGFVYLGDSEKGTDGTTTIKIADFIGVKSSEKKRGLRCYEEVDEVSMICMPDIMIQPIKLPLPFKKPTPKEPDPCLPRKKEMEEEVSPPYEPPIINELSPEFSKEDIHIAQQRMIDHCESMKDRMAILDPPFRADLSGVQDWRRQFDSKYAACYYSWIRVDDPLKLDNQITRLIPPSGHIAGIYARNDLTRGVHKAPANEEVLGANDVRMVIESHEQEILNPMGINCLRIFPGRGVMVWGARTVSSDKCWKFVNVRRLLMMIEESIEEAMQWTVFEPNGFNLWMGIRISVSSFLEELWRKGALAGSIPEEAFYVKCDEVTNPQYVIDAGEVITEIGVAPIIPGEFIVFKIRRVDDRLEFATES